MIKSKKTIIILLSWIAVILWMVLIFKLSSQVADQSDGLSKGVTERILEMVENVAPKVDFDIVRFNHLLRKSAHFFIYLVLGLLVMNAMIRSEIMGLRICVLALLICVLYATSDEVHQLFVPGRGGQIRDIFIDSGGATIGICMYHMFIRIKKMK